MIRTKKPHGRQRNRPLKDYAGVRFGRLVAVELVEREPVWNGHRWRFRCDCGGEIVANIKGVRGGKTTSCGCARRELVKARNTTHGLSDRAEYKVWKDMRARCRDSKNKEFANYGGRGIAVCPAWNDFATFYADMGACAPGMTIERCDVNGNYEPGNCVWASRETQANNKRSTVRLTIGGETRSLTQWCRQYGIGRRTVQYRLAHGMAPIDALTAGDLRSAR